MPQWPAPAGVRAYVTTRKGGHSGGAFAGFNLGDHVGDEPQAVARNRALLRETLELPAEPAWLQQVHGCAVARPGIGEAVPCADAAFSDVPGDVCAVLTADCLPLLMCDRAGTRVAAVHAGWRGLAAGVVEAALDAMDRPGEEILCWLGPAIGPDAFEVGDEVRREFRASDPGSVEAFAPGADGRWTADLYRLARRRLAARGVAYVGGGDYCTYRQPDLFYSYRRDGVTGRMASLIWIDPDIRTTTEAIR